MEVCNCSMFCCTLLVIMSILVLLSSGWGRERWVLCLVCLPGMVSRDCCVDLPSGAMGMSAVFDCSISWSY